jgi:hypothetical protein
LNKFARNFFTIFLFKAKIYTSGNEVTIPVLDLEIKVKKLSEGYFIIKSAVFHTLGTESST